MNKLITAVLFSAFLVFANTASASSGVYGGYGAPCQPIYGGGETCVSKGNILINKTVQNPSTNAFVDNLSLSNDPKYHPGDNVTFQLNISNTGDKSLDEVEVTDILPSYVTFVSGPGTFDSNTKKLTFKLFNLGAGASQTVKVVAKVVGINNLPSDQAVNCVVNQAMAKADNQESSDVSQFCIEKIVTTTKGGLPVMPAPKVKQTPATGPEMLPLLGMIPAGLGGFFLRRRASK